MEGRNFSFSSSQFNKLFPFYILIDEDNVVVSFGESLAKIFQIPPGARFSELFRFVRPSEGDQMGFMDVVGLTVILECRNNPAIVLRGQFEFTDDQHVLFAGTPWFGTVDQVVRHNLTIRDFALHDPMIDLLHVLKAQEITTTEIKELLNKVNHQKKVLFKSESQMSTLVQNLRTGILMEDDQHQVILVNATFCEIFGIIEQPDRLKGLDRPALNARATVHFVHADGYAGRVGEEASDKMPVLAEKLEMTNGRIVERNYIPVYVAGQFKGHLWKFIDVTDRENVYRKLIRQEEKYRSIIENMNLGILEVNLEDEIQYVNNSFCELSGYSRSELLGRRASDLLVDSGSISTIEQKTELRKEGVSDGYEIKVKDKHGNSRYWFVSGAPNYNLQGELIGSIGIHLDVTEQKKLEEQLRVAKEKAEESSKAKESFLANMSHEIRTPLNAIVGMMRELKRSQLSADQSTYVKHVDSASQHLQAIINNILDISKIEAGEFALENQVFGLRQVFEETRAMAAPQMKEKLLNFTVDVNEKLAANFMGDPHRVRQVMLNIVSNAVKFTEKGGITIRCGVVEDTLEAQRVHISIEDTGIGMESDYLRSLFTKFTQESITIARKYGGTGLGMAITHELVTLMGGEIKVQSEKGVGTRFDIYLTFRKAEVKAEQNGVNADEIQSSLSGIRVLLVEDNEMNRLVARNSLSYAGIEVDEAVNGEMALQRLSNNTYDVILMDLHMPVMDGLVATTRIRGHMKIRTPIIALSANAFKNEIDRCFQIGMNDYVTKPFDEAVLVSTISRHAGKRPVKKTETVAVPAAQKKPLYDLSQLIALSHGDKTFVEKMVGLFCQSMPEYLQGLSVAIEARDAKGVAAVVHKMKPVLANLGMVSLHTTIRQLEAVNREATDWDRVVKLAGEVDSTVGQVVADLERQQL